jgi:hypothetical protein
VVRQEEVAGGDSASVLGPSQPSHFSDQCQLAVVRIQHLGANCLQAQHTRRNPSLFSHT